MDYGQIHRLANKRLCPAAAPATEKGTDGGEGGAHLEGGEAISDVHFGLLSLQERRVKQRFHLFYK